MRRIWRRCVMSVGEIRAIDKVGVVVYQVERVERGGVISTQESFVA